MRELVVQYWKPIAGVTAVVLLPVVGYAFGRYAVPEKVVVQERVEVVEVEVEKVVVVEKVVEKKVYQEAEKSRIRREETTRTLADGTTETKKTEDIGVDRVVKDTQIEYVDRVVEKEVVKYVDRVVEKEVQVESERPAWRISPMVGVSVPGTIQTIGDGTIDVTKIGVVGLKLDRRIVGPVTVGAWGLSSGQAGLSIGLEF